MAMYRPGASTTLVTGGIVGPSGSAFDMLVREVDMDASTPIREVTYDGVTETTYATNSLHGGRLILRGFANSGAPLKVGNLGTSTLTDVDVTIISFSGTAATDTIVVSCTAARIKTVYQKSIGGVAVAFIGRISKIVHGT